MKKMFKYASLGAIALVGAVSFSACSSSDEIVDNPDYNPVEGTVKTQFAIGITSQANAYTRMSDATTQAQATPGFRGMQDIILIPFDKEPNNTAYRIGRYIQPGEGKISGSEVTGEGLKSLTSTANYVVYSDVEVPVGTTHFLFYGHAPASAFTEGQLTTTNAYPVGPITLNDASNAFTNLQTSLTFTPTSILPNVDDKEAGNNDKGKALIALLNAVASAKANVTIGTSTTEKTWASVTSDENGLLYQLYTNFKEMTSGSSFNVHRALQDLYYSVNNLAGTTDNPYSSIALAIQTAIKANGTNSVSEDAKTLTFGDNYKDYPEAVLKIPEGAAKIKWDNTQSKFVDGIMNNQTNGGDNIGATTSAPTVYSTYAYPADLWYWKKTAIHASNQIESTDFGDKNWDNIISTDYANTPTVVSGSTKSVALDGSINYAVGRLDLSINSLSGTFLDSKLNVMDFGKAYADNSTDETTAPNGFKNAIELTGVLVGNQKAVDWQFLPVGTKEFVIYDNEMNNGSNPIVSLSTTANSGTNHTLVLETAENADVNIALQFKNNGGDFYGKDGQLIPSGGTFYLAGTLKVTEKTAGSPDLSQIFKQDYITTVALSIKPGSNDSDNDGNPDSPEGFQEATNTIPDLRTTLMELCFSVDLTWKQGLTFNVEW